MFPGAWNDLWRLSPWTRISDIGWNKKPRQILVTQPLLLMTSPFFGVFETCFQLYLSSHVWLSICIVKCQSTYTNTNLPAYPSTWILLDLPTNSPFIYLPTSLLSCCHQVHLRDHRPQRGKWLVALRQNGRGAQGSRGALCRDRGHDWPCGHSQKRGQHAVCWGHLIRMERCAIWKPIRFSEDITLKINKSSQFRNLRQTPFTFDVNWNPGLPDFPIFTNEQRLDLPKVKAVQEMLGVLTWSSLVKGL